MPIKINLLCSHHFVDGFDCGNATLNEVISGRTGAGFAQYDPVEGLMVVADDENLIRGYLTLANMRLVLERGGQTEDCLYFAQIGVTRDAQGKILALRLYKRAEAILDLRAARRKLYAAMIATTVHNEGMGERLERMGFKPVLDSSLMWFKRLGTPV